jgi:hypothetical protein
MSKNRLEQPAAEATAGRSDRSQRLTTSDSGRTGQVVSATDQPRGLGKLLPPRLLDINPRTQAMAR